MHEVEAAVRMTRVQRPERPTQFSGTKRRHVTVLLLRLADHVAAHESRRVYGLCSKMPHSSGHVHGAALTLCYRR